MATLDGDAGRRHVADLDRVVLAGDDGVREVLADLLGVDVERGDELNVANVVRAELHVHEAWDSILRVGVLVILNALHQEGAQLPTPTIAVRIELMSIPFRLSDSPGSARAAGFNWLIGLCIGGSRAGLFCGDELGEPPHFSFHPVEAMTG